MAQAPAATALPATAQAGSALGMVLLLSLTYFLAYYDRLLMVVVGEMVKAEFALSDKQLSLLTGASFVIIYGTFGIAAGWLVDRWSRKKILIWTLVAWSVLTAASGAAQNFVQLALARAGVGVGESANVPAAISAISDRYPPAKRPLAIAIFYAGGMVGILCCFLVGTWVASEYGWRAAFYVAGPPGLVVALLLAVAFREPAREKAPAAAAGEVVARSTFGLVWHNRPLRMLLVAGAVAAFINIGMVTWLPIFFLRSHGLSLKQVGLYFGPVLAAGMTAGLLLGGWLGNRAATRANSSLVTFSGWILFAVVPLYLAIFWLPSLPFALGATFVGTTLSVLYAAPYNAAWGTICDPRARGTAAGLSSFANSILGGAGCTFLVGLLSDALAPTLGRESLRYALTASLVFCLIAGALFMYAARLIRADERAAARAA